MIIQGATSIDPRYRRILPNQFRRPRLCLPVSQNTREDLLKGPNAPYLCARIARLASTFNAYGYEQFADGLYVRRQPIRHLLVPSA